MSELAMIVIAARQVVSGALVLFGLVLLLGGALGVLRFPDFYTRLHAVAAAHSAGAALVVVGLAISVGDLGIALKLLLLAGLIAAMAPALSQILANAAHSGGLAPLSGPYTAPRPGSARRAEPTP
jgi:multicomponent Na+:H+ antiporter subunit G